MADKERLQKLALEKQQDEIKERDWKTEEDKKIRKLKDIILEEVLAKNIEESYQSQYIKDRLREQILTDEKGKEQIQLELLEEIRQEQARRNKLKDARRLKEIIQQKQLEEELALDTPGVAKALGVAKSVYYFMRSLRLKYVETVVAELQKKGYGAALNVKELKGYVPLPATFLHQVAVTFKEGIPQGASFALAQRSLWNLNLDNGLKDEFETEGWAFLAQQQEEQIQAQEPLKDIYWRPFIEVEESEGEKVLRYLGAEPAALSTCVACHNKWERLFEVKNLRAIDGLDEKEFQLHELMGALSITIPIEETES